MTVIPYIVFGCFLLFGSLFLLITVLAAGQGLLAKRRPAAPGKVIRSGISTDVREAPGGRPTTWVTHGADVEYEYQVGGETLTGHAIHVGNARSGGARQAQRVANRYPPGADVLVYYSPADPADAVLEPGVPPGLWKVAVIGGPFFAVGLGGLLGVAGLLRVREADLFLILGLPTVLIGGLLTWAAVRNLQRGAASTHWPTVPGRVVASVVRQGGFGSRPTSEPHIVYQYTVGGTPYSHSAVDLGGLAGSSAGPAAAVVARYPVGTTVSVYHDPAHPERAVLEPGRRWSNLFLLAVGLPFLTFGAGLLVARFAGR